jgi:aerobic-type carbon monoxide dehydrogenase small subunit (CoxS/CutS family)
VVGSSTHFTVLFSRDRRTNSESDEEAILSRVQRAFKEVDAEQCGFILADSLDKVLLKLGLLPSNDPTYLSR